MLRVIKSEGYKLCRRVYPYVFLGVVCGLGLLWVILFTWVNHASDGGSFRYEDTLYLVFTILPIGVFFTPAFMDMVFSEEYKNQTMKNTVSFGVPRASLYLGKLLVEWVTAVVSLLIILVVVLGSAWLLMGPRNPAEALELTRSLGLRLLGALPLWTGALCVIHMLAFQFKSSTLYTIGFVAVFMTFSEVLKMLGALISPVFLTIRDWMIMPQFDVLSGGAVTGAVVGKCWLVGLGFSLVFTLAGLLAFRRKEIR